MLKTLSNFAYVVSRSHPCCPTVHVSALFLFNCFIEQINDDDDDKASSKEDLKLAVGVWPQLGLGLRSGMGLEIYV